MKKFFRGEHFYILFELQSQEYERVKFRAAVVNMDHTVPLLYVAEYHCDGTVKVSFIKLKRTPGSVKRIIEQDKNNIVTNERFTIEIDGTDYEIINVEDVSNIDTEDSFLEMIRKYSDFHGMMLYDVPFSDVKCELYHIDYSQYMNVGLDDDGIWDETETNEQIKADFYQKNEDRLEIGYYYVYEKPDILEGLNIMPATELRVEEYGIESKIRTGKVMVACVKDYLHSEYIPIPSVVEFDGRNYTVIGLDIRCFSGCKAKEIRLPETIEYIGEVCFSGCENLVYIRMPRAIKFMGREALIGYQKLKEVEIPEGLEFSIHCISAFNYLEKVYVHKRRF